MNTLTSDNMNSSKNELIRILHKKHELDKVLIKTGNSYVVVSITLNKNYDPEYDNPSSEVYVESNNGLNYVIDDIDYWIILK